jgi:hypothetical protein
VGKLRSARHANRARTPRNSTSVAKTGFVGEPLTNRKVSTCSRCGVRVAFCENSAQTMHFPGMGNFFPKWEPRIDKLERETGIEPVTSSLGSWRSTAELLPLDFARLPFRSLPDNVPGGRARVCLSPALPRNIPGLAYELIPRPRRLDAYRCPSPEAQLASQISARWSDHCSRHGYVSGTLFGSRCRSFICVCVCAPGCRDIMTAP